MDKKMELLGWAGQVCWPGWENVRGQETTSNASKSCEMEV